MKKCHSEWQRHLQGLVDNLEDEPSAELKAAAAAFNIKGATATMEKRLHLLAKSLGLCLTIEDEMM